MPFVNIRIVKEVIAADPAGKKADIAKIQSEKGRLTLTVQDGPKVQMNVIEGLSLREPS